MVKKFFLFLLILPALIYSKSWQIEPVLINNQSYYPLYKIINILRIERDWDFYSEKFLLKNNENYIVFIPDEDKLYFNRQLKILKYPIIRFNGVIYIPSEVVEYIFNLVDESWSFKFLNNNGIEIADDERKEQVIVKNEENFTNEKKFYNSDDSSGKIFEIENNREIFKASNPNRIKVIIIDPGHGGEDPGAIGQVGLTEKEVVLNVGLKLRDILRKLLPDVKIVMTREKDIFIPLNKRAEIANKNVDKNTSGIFISIHCNASYNKKTSGFETYILSPVASDAEARAVAAMENGIIDLNKKDFSTGRIITQLLSAEYIRESTRLAELLQNSYRKNLPQNFEDRGVKKALFYVLEGTLMPAVLTEIGFITNKEEEKLLRNPEYQYKIALSIADGILEFIKWYDINNGFVFAQ
jgi:N-acetylmuramoyl-L-alanine amidase